MTPSQIIALEAKVKHTEELRRRGALADYAPPSKAPSEVKCDARYRYWAAGTMCSCSWPDCACVV